MSVRDGPHKNAHGCAPRTSVFVKETTMATNETTNGETELLHDDEAHPAQIDILERQ